MKAKPESHSLARDLRLDSLRGLFLICMTVDHLPTELRRLTDQSLGVFSAAEGFVFLSGLIAGWVYTRRRRDRGPRGLWDAALARTRTIYSWHVASFVGALLCVLGTEYACGYCSPNAPRLFFQHPLEALGLGLALLYQPGLLDLLPMYCILVLLLPLAIGGLEAGRRWLVLSLSAALWIVAQWAPAADMAHLYPINTGSFNILGWQFIFVAGLAFGHARASGVAQMARPRPLVLLAAAAVVVYGLGIRHAQWPPLWPDALYGIFLNKPALGLLRIADFGAFAYLVAALGARFPRALSVRPLAFLGKYSIAVVAAQSVLVMTLLQFPGLFTTAADRAMVALSAIAMLFATAAARQGLGRLLSPPAPRPANPVSAGDPRRLKPAG